MLSSFFEAGSSGWRSGNTISIQKAASYGGIQLMFSNAEQKQENQIKAIRSFIAYRVDVIAFVPIVETGWENVLAEGKQTAIDLLKEGKINCVIEFNPLLGPTIVDMAKRLAGGKAYRKMYTARKGFSQNGMT